MFDFTYTVSMNYHSRKMHAKLTELAEFYPILVVCGPRQSGKSTLVKHVFSEYRYVSLEDIDQRSFATHDPRGFLEHYADQVIIDEVQRVPALFSYLQTHVDASPHAAHYVLTGSAQLDLVAGVTQSLAGRAALFQLLPLAHTELPKRCARHSLEKTLYSGAYPRVQFDRVPIMDWYQDYIASYLERDVRQLINIKQLGTFQLFLKMCAARCGQIVNHVSLAEDCGISPNTAKTWLNVLEASYVIFRLPPFYRNYSKRLIKSPKLYFYDTGIVCALLGIRAADDLVTHSLRGGLFESWVISEYKKRFFNAHRDAPLYFWRDSKGREIDLVIEHQQQFHALEIKSGKTVNTHFFNNLDYLRSLAGDDMLQQCLVYGGRQSQKRSQGHIVSWQELEQFCID